MILYKYLNPKRIDVLQNLKIRYTQPPYLNDPYDSNPFISGVNLSDAQLKELEEKGIDPKIVEIFKTKKSRNKLIKEMLPIMTVFLHNTIGILSLSETWNNHIMWAHYSANHSGFILGLESTHSFFISKEDDPFFDPNIEDYNINNLYKVIYSDDRPKLSLERLNVQDLYFTKSIYWDYEKEWRIIKELNTADSRILKKEIFLFNLPTDIIKSITIGANTTLEFDAKIINCLRDQNLYIPIYKIVLNRSNYSLNRINYFKWFKLKYKPENVDFNNLMETIRKFIYTKKIYFMGTRLDKKK